MSEFLPLCDVLFNVISLAGYFCDVVFDVVMSYALLERGYKGTFAAAMSIIVTSLLISQILSLRWYVHCVGSRGPGARVPWPPLLLHCLQLGVLWRYARLFVPVDLRHVKHQVRDLCMLRLVHAFCEAAPMLLLQLHVLLALPTPEQAELLVDPTRDEPAANKAFAELNVISASLSLFSMCWALASFSKNVRLQNVHRLVLTWLGVIFQFLWRLGTISARVCALALYAQVYEYWVFLVIGLHWVSMYLWLISPRSAFSGERMSAARRAYLSALVAGVYVFAYVNLHERGHRQKMITFYCVMLIENCLLLGAWGVSRPRSAAPAQVAAGAFLAGLLCMLLYYRYFHVRRLGYMLRENQQGTNSTNASSENKNGKQPSGDNAAIPGVFNCRFTNPVGNGLAPGRPGRKKKKPTSFVPVPPPPAPAGAAPTAPAAAPAHHTQPQPAFWRRPLPATHNHHGGSSENEGSSVGSRVNIQQKLQEKKQKQLAELRVIEEEIKQGKLTKTTPVAVEEIYSSLQRQPIPRAKTHMEPPAWSSVDLSHAYQNYPLLPHTCNIYPTYTEIKQYDFQADHATNFNMGRLPDRIYNQESRSFYENPANLRNEARTPLRSNYLGETRSYENGCGSPRNVLNNSPRCAEANYERPTTSPLDKRIPLHNSTTIYEDSRQDYYCDNYKEEYAQNTLTKGIVYNEGYGQNERRISKLDLMRKMQRCRTPEILLAPHYLEGCCHWGAPAPPYNMSRKEEGPGSAEGAGAAGVGADAAGAGAAGSSGDEAQAWQPRAHSDIDSQISLPRSYTLPREFRYWRRRPRLRDAHVPSNNSSDADVDSADEAEQRRCAAPAPPYLLAGRDGRDGRRAAPRKQLAKPETKL